MVMVRYAEPVEKILLHQPLLSEDSDSEDEVREHNYDTEYYVNQRKKLVQMDRLLTVATSLVFAATLLFIWFDERLQNPLYYTHGVFDNPLWTVAIALYIVLLSYVASDWWKTRLLDD